MVQVSSIFDEFGMPASESPMRIGVGVGRLDGALSTRKEARAPHRAAPPVLRPPSTRIQVMCYFVRIYVISVTSVAIFISGIERKKDWNSFPRVTVICEWVFKIALYSN